MTLDTTKIEFPVITQQLLSDARINPFAVQLLAESVLKHTNPAPFAFMLPVNRKDCAGWAGIKIYVEPVLKQEGN